MTNEQIKETAILLAFSANMISEYENQNLAQVAGVSDEEANAAIVAHRYWVRYFRDQYLAVGDSAADELSTYSAADWELTLHSNQ